MSTWQAFAEAIARRNDAGRETVFWWRDDDAAAPTPEIERLLALSCTASVPLALAVIPESAVPELFALLRDEVYVLQHGADHRNRAAADAKKTEFPAAEPDADALERLRGARVRLAQMAGARALPVLAPPWNRLRRDLAHRLREAGIPGLSMYRTRPSPPPVPGVTQIDTHVDLVAWHAGRGFIGEAQALALAMSHFADEPGPIGWLTHHAVHQRDAMDFLARLFDASRRAGARGASPPEMWPSA
ncbi:MAG: polysaccharide deacetylase family protein [Betaproteobacteria bacterium]